MRKTSNTFTFDMVFGVDITQAEVYTMRQCDLYCICCIRSSVVLVMKIILTLALVVNLICFGFSFSYGRF